MQKPKINKLKHEAENTNGFSRLKFNKQISIPIRRNI